MVFNAHNFMVISLSTAFFFIIYRYVSPLISSKWFRRYSKLSKRDSTEWNERIVSSVHAVIAAVVSTTVLVTDKDMEKDPVWTNSLIAKSILGFTWSYMVVDMAIMCTYFRLPDLVYFFHHFAAIFAYYVAIEMDFLVWFACVRLTAEWSTTFVNNRWHMCIAGGKDSKFYMLNGLLMVLAFFLCRVVPMPYFWYQVYLYYDTIPTLGFGVLVFSCVILDSLNLFWMYKLTIGLFRTLGTTQFVSRIRHTLSKVMEDFNTLLVM